MKLAFYPIREFMRIAIYCNNKFSQQLTQLPKSYRNIFKSHPLLQVHRDDENTMLLLFYLLLGIAGFLIVVMSIIAIYITFLKEVWCLTVKCLIPSNLFNFKELTLHIDLADQSRDVLLETEDEEQTLAGNYVIQKIEKRTIPIRTLSALSKVVVFLQSCVKKLMSLPSKFYKNVSNGGENKMIETS